MAIQSDIDREKQIYRLKKLLRLCPTDIKKHIMQKQFSIKCCLFKMETRFVFGKYNVAMWWGGGYGFGPVLLLVRKTRTYFLVKPNIPGS